MGTYSTEMKKLSLKFIQWIKYKTSGPGGKAQILRKICIKI